MKCFNLQSCFECKVIFRISTQMCRTAKFCTEFKSFVKNSKVLFHLQECFVPNSNTNVSIYSLSYFPNFTTNVSTCKVLYRIQEFCSEFKSLVSFIREYVPNCKANVSTRCHFQEYFVPNFNTNVSTFTVCSKFKSFVLFLGVYLYLFLFTMLLQMCQPAKCCSII